jgi:hypothetical protein
MDERTYATKAQQVMSGNTVLATASYGPPSHVIGLTKVPGEDCFKKTAINGVRSIQLVE